MSLAYSIDTSSLVAAWAENYPIGIFPSFWSKLERLIQEGRAGCIAEVKIDLSKKNDALREWADGVVGIYHELTEDVQRSAMAILSHPEHQKLTNSVKGRSRSDPWVIALAHVHGARVITQEGSAPKKIKIPDVCAGLDIQCTNLLGLMVAEGWTFG